MQLKVQISSSFSIKQHIFLETNFKKTVQEYIYFLCLFFNIEVLIYLIHDSTSIFSIKFILW